MSERPRRFTEDTADMWSAADLSKRVFANSEVPVDRRKSDRAGRVSRYYCDNRDCDVRTVDLLIKYTGGPAIDACKCPACGESIRILADLESLVLIEEK